MLEQTLNYTGNIDIVLPNGKTMSIHNQGSKPLFHLIHKILGSVFTLNTTFSSELPAFFTLIDSSSNQDVIKLNNGDYSAVVDKCHLLYDIPITSKVVTETNILFSGLLTHNMIKSAFLTDCYLLLLNSTKDKILAFARVSKDALKPVQEDNTGQAAIDWRMSFSNNTEEGNEL